MSIEFYPFELHTHSVHSDGRFTPDELAESAAKAGLRGFALTDHNTSSGAPHAAAAAAKHGLIFIPGIEWTTFYGHITVLGGDFGIDWREVNPDSVCRLASHVKEAGGAVGIAHPFRIGFPICTGGSDDWGIEDYKDFTHYEIWSYRDPSEERTNKLAEKRYFELAKCGSRLSCVYGRDWHGKEDGLFAATFLGMDGEPTAAKALDAVRRGRSYVSTGVTLNARLSDENGTVYAIGDTLPAGEYTLEARLLPPRVGFSNENDFRPETLTLNFGKGNTERLQTVDGVCVRRIKLERGILSLSAEGKVNGKSRTLLIATPYIII